MKIGSDNLSRNFSENDLEFVQCERRGDYLGDQTPEIGDLVTIIATGHPLVSQYFGNDLFDYSAASSVVFCVVSTTGKNKKQKEKKTSCICSRNPSHPSLYSQIHFSRNRKILPNRSSFLIVLHAHAHIVYYVATCIPRVPPIYLHILC